MLLCILKAGWADFNFDRGGSEMVGMKGCRKEERESNKGKDDALTMSS